MDVWIAIDDSHASAFVHVQIVMPIDVLDVMKVVVWRRSCEQLPQKCSFFGARGANKIFLQIKPHVD